MMYLKIDGNTFYNTWRSIQFVNGNRCPDSEQYLHQPGHGHLQRHLCWRHRRAPGQPLVEQVAGRSPFSMWRNNTISTTPRFYKSIVTGSTAHQGLHDAIFSYYVPNRNTYIINNSITGPRARMRINYTDTGIVQVAYNYVNCGTKQSVNIGDPEGVTHEGIFVGTYDHARMCFVTASDNTVDSAMVGGIRAVNWNGPPTDLPNYSAQLYHKHRAYAACPACEQ